MRSPMIVLLAAALAVSPADAAAQLRLGARAGLNEADVRAETGQETELPQNGMLFGAFVQGGLRGRLGFEAGAQYSPKGILELVTVDDGAVEVELEVGYLELPILATYALRAFGPMALVASVGGAPAFRIRCESTASYGDEFIRVQCGEEDPSTGFGVEPVKSFDVTGMLGVSFPLGGGAPSGF
jgi:hypothetical protein